MVDTARTDLRPFNACRELALKTDIVSGANGSASVALGDTSVLCVLHGPQYTAKRDERGAREGIADVKLEQSILLPDQAMSEWTVKRFIESTVLMTTLPGATLNVVAHIVEEHGGFASCLLNSIVMSLLSAGIPMRYIPVSATVAVQNNNTILADPTREELDVRPLTLNSPYRLPRSL